MIIIIAIRIAKELIALKHVFLIGIGIIGLGLVETVIIIVTSFNYILRFKGSPPMTGDFAPVDSLPSS
jgi:hypothetical protein